MIKLGQIDLGFSNILMDFGNLRPSKKRVHQLYISFYLFMLSP